MFFHVKAMMQSIEHELEVTVRVHEVRSEYERQMEEWVPFMHYFDTNPCRYTWLYRVMRWLKLEFMAGYVSGYCWYYLVSLILVEYSFNWRIKSILPFFFTFVGKIYWFVSVIQLNSFCVHILKICFPFRWYYLVEKLLKLIYLRS